MEKNKRYRLVKILLIGLISCFLMIGCSDIEPNLSERISWDGKDKERYDDSHLVLKDGYFIKDYIIDYEHLKITFNLEHIKD